LEEQKVVAVAVIVPTPSLSRAWPCFRVFGLGGARASRAGDGALAIVNCFNLYSSINLRSD